MSGTRIFGRKSSIHIDGNEIIISKPGTAFGSGTPATVIISSKTQMLVKLPTTASEGFVAVMDEYPSMTQRRLLHPSADPKTIVLPVGFSKEEAIAFLQVFWNIKSKIPKEILAPRKKSKKTGLPTGTQWYIDYKSGYLRDYVAVAIKTTGNRPVKDKIIEIAAVRYIDDIIVSRFTSFIRPYTASLMTKYSHEEFNALAGVGGIKYIDDEEITKATGISNEMLEDAPTAKQIGPEFFDFVGNLPVIGHNISGPVRTFLRKLASETTVKTNFGHDIIDTVKIVKEFSDFDSEDLQEIGTACGIYNYPSSPRVLDEVLYIGQLFQHFKGELSKEELEDVREYQKRYVSAFVIQPNPEIYRLGGSLFGKFFVFTGDMAIRRAEALQRVADHGGTPLQTVTKKTNYLVISERDDEISVMKMQKAREYIHQNQDLEIVTESDFYKMLS